MLKIKFARTGRKKMPFFRILVLESTKDTYGNYVENIGHFNPRSKELTLDADRAKYWLSKGAQPTDRVHNIFVTEGIIEDKKRNVSALGSKEKKKREEEKAKAAEEAAKAREAKNEEGSVKDEGAEAPATPEADAAEVTEEKPEEKKEEATPEAGAAAEEGK